MIMNQNSREERRVTQVMATRKMLGPEEQDLQYSLCFYVAGSLIHLVNMMFHYKDQIEPYKDLTFG